MKITVLHILQHVPFEGPGHVLAWAAKRGVATRLWHLYKGEKPTRPGRNEALCIMGGPMNIYEDEAFPWLRWERDFLSAEAKLETPMLGICLGAQLLAHAHGSRVFKNKIKEIGWMELQFVDSELRKHLSLPAAPTVLHWHGDTFDLPPDARRLAQTEHCLNQAYVCGRSLGLQFHLEAGPDECERMIAHCGDELASPGATIHDTQALRAGALRHSAATAVLLDRLLDWHFQA